MSTATKIQPVELSVIVKGEVISNNFPAFKEFALSQMEGINLELETDDHFKQAKSDVKSLQDFEKNLDQVDKQIIESMDEINVLLTGTRELREVSGTKRKHLAGLAKTRTAELKESLIQAGIGALAIQAPDFVQAVRDSIFRKSSLKGMQDAITETVEGINARVAEVKALVMSFECNHGSDIVHGLNQLLLMPRDTLQIELERRVERRTADRKAEKLRAETEALKATARIKELEVERKAEEIRKAEQVQRLAGIAKLNEAAQEMATEEEPAETPAPQAVPLTQAEELSAFLKIFAGAFAPIKAARAELVHPENIAAGERFAEGFGNLFQALSEGGSK